MILSLLKNRGLRLQLLVGLLLVLGTFPEPSDGLKCYACVVGNVEEETCKNPIECGPGEYCFSRRWGGETTVSMKGCMSAAQATCLKQEFDSDCKVSKTVEDSEKLTEIEGRCSVAARDEKFKDDGFVSTCVCNTDLCNTGSSGGHSTSVIITALLTVALYNYA